MRYEYAGDLQEIAEDMCRVLFPHIKTNSIMCFRSYGTSSTMTIARCHTLDKIMQKALGRSSFYVLEFLTEHFEKQTEEAKEKIILHELMHIPKTFGGGFKHHDFVTEKNVNKYYKIYLQRKNEISENQTTL